MQGTGRRRKWTADNMHEAFWQLILKWQHAADQMTWKKDDDKKDALRATGHNPAYWLDEPPRIEEITAEIDLILSATHDRTRTELRKRISNHCAVRELAVEAGKIGKPLASLLD